MNPDLKQQFFEKFCWKSKDGEVWNWQGCTSTEVWAWFEEQLEKQLNSKFVELEKEVERLKKALKLCIARAGNYDPNAACRNVIKTAKEALGEPHAK